MADKRVNPPVDPHNAASDSAAGGKKKTVIPPFTPTPTKKKTQGYISPVPGVISLQRQDQGQDYKGAVGSFVVAIGSARIDYVGPASGFGQMVIYTLTSGKSAGTRIYIGHAQPVKGLAQGQTVAQGANLAVLLQKPLGNATVPGWTEVGIADDNANKPKYSLVAGGVMFKQVMGARLTPTDKTNIKAIQAASDAGSTQYINATTDLAAVKAQAKVAAHINDPWVTVVKDKSGVTRFGIATGYNAPANALTYAGSPLTKSELSSVWSARYANIYEEFTGKVATPGVIVQVLDGGFSSYGLQAALVGGKLQSWKAFTNSPIYKSQLGGFQDSAQQILGGNAPRAVLQQAFAENWTDATFKQNLRTYKAPDGSHPYLKGPEFTNNQAAMQTTYQKIYGAPDENAHAAINEAAGNGWDANHFANYLRQQPEYTTSIEYQSNAVNMLDNLGLLFRMAPVMKPTKPSERPSGGDIVPNSSLVPGQAKTLNPVLGVGASLQPIGDGSG